MKNILILGAGTGGTMMANHLSRKIDHKEWKITVIDQHENHYYQPGFLFIPFGKYDREDVIKQKTDFLPKKVDYIQEEVETIEPDNNQINLRSGGQVDFDILIIATGTKIVPEELDGLAGDNWHKKHFDFYTIEGSTALADKLNNWDGGKLAIHINEMPIKCPVAPIEFAYLADEFFTKKEMREDVEINFVTPLDGAFTKKKTAEILGELFAERNINIAPNFMAEKVDNEKNQLVCYDGRTVDFDLLVTVPTNMGDQVIARSDMGDELNFVPTNKHTLQAENWDNIFVIGDASNLPASKAGSVAHFESEVLTENILNFIDDKPLVEDFDGHANCFIESGYGKGFLIDFNYDTPPVPGKFPFPVVGPMSLLKESKLNHWGKLAFKWIYWHVLLKGLPMPGIPTQMSKLGKKI